MWQALGASLLGGGGGGGGMGGMSASSSASSGGGTNTMSNDWVMGNSGGGAGNGNPNILSYYHAKNGTVATMPMVAPSYQSLAMVGLIGVGLYLVYKGRK